MFLEHLANGCWCGWIIRSLDWKWFLTRMIVDANGYFGTLCWWCICKTNRFLIQHIILVEQVQSMCFFKLIVDFFGTWNEWLLWACFWNMVHNGCWCVWIICSFTVCIRNNIQRFSSMLTHFMSMLTNSIFYIVHCILWVFVDVYSFYVESTISMFYKVYGKLHLIGFCWFRWMNMSTSTNVLSMSINSLSYIAHYKLHSTGFSWCQQMNMLRSMNVLSTLINSLFYRVHCKLHLAGCRRRQMIMTTLTNFLLYIEHCRLHSMVLSMPMNVLSTSINSLFYRVHCKLYLVGFCRCWQMKMSTSTNFLLYRDYCKLHSVGFCWCQFYVDIDEMLVLQRRL